MPSILLASGATQSHLISLYAPKQSIPIKEDVMKCLR